MKKNQSEASKNKLAGNKPRATKCQVILFLSIISSLLPSETIGQGIELLKTGCTESLRGLSVVSPSVVWASGSRGTVGRSIDSGRSWKWTTIKGFEKTDFRDIEAFDETSALVMGTGDPAQILRTSDGGESWKLVFSMSRPGIFLDALEFWNDQSGIAIGDPLNGKLFIIRSFDGGFHWQPLPEKNLPSADSSEALFASSGTNIRKLNKQEAVFVTGGRQSRYFYRDQSVVLPLAQGSESKGANSIAVKNEKTLIVVGGDYRNPGDTTGNCAYSTDGGQHWQKPIRPPGGYRSCVEHIRKMEWICTGTNGTDISRNDGRSWETLSAEGFHVCRKSKIGNAVFFAGTGGKMGVLRKP
jgi:photosystem II stability/assembly factor-like uncharacterized protein